MLDKEETKKSLFVSDFYNVQKICYPEKYVVSNKLKVTKKVPTAANNPTFSR